MTGTIVAIILTALTFTLGAWIGARRCARHIGKHAFDCVTSAKSKEQRVARAEAYRDLFLAMGVKPSNRMSKG